MPCLPPSGKLFMVANSLILLIAHTYARWQAVTQLTLQQTKYYLTKIALGSSCFTASLTCLVMFLNILLQNNFMDYFLCCVFFPHLTPFCWNAHHCLSLAQAWFSILVDSSSIHSKIPLCTNFSQPCCLSSGNPAQVWSCLILLAQIRAALGLTQLSGAMHTAHLWKNEH